MINREMFNELLINIANTVITLFVAICYGVTMLLPLIPALIIGIIIILAILGLLLLILL